MPRGILGQFKTQILKVFPDCISMQDLSRLEYLQDETDYSVKIPIYEEFADRYAHPFFYAQLGCMLGAVEADALMIRRLRQAQAALRDMQLSDAHLERILDFVPRRREDAALNVLSKSKTICFDQTWRPASSYAYPASLRVFPSQVDAIRQIWQALDAAERARYLRHLVIETLQIEDVFTLTEAAIRALITLGFDYAEIQAAPGSRLRSTSEIRNILKDTLMAYNMLEVIAPHWEALDRNCICALHAVLMRSCRFSGGRHVTIGETRTFTRTTVIVGGLRPIEVCPFPLVDSEMEVICELVKGRLGRMADPFAAASWIHLIFVRCHPFEDGNGRISRMLASIPLLLDGLPPCAMTLLQRTYYYDAINKAYGGDHMALAQGMVHGISTLLPLVI